MVERTLLIIKPDAISRGMIGEVIRRVETAGFIINAMKMLRLSKANARKFYEVHKGKQFYDELVEFMSSGPVVVMVLSREDAVDYLRKIIGATDPLHADEGTIRKDLAIDTCRNTVHASDSKASAQREISFFFTEDEIRKLRVTFNNRSIQ